MSEIGVTAGLSATEHDTLIQLLSKIRQPWAAQLYLALCPHFCLTATETVFLREMRGEVFVLLPDRHPDDPNWGGMPHSPGSMLRATDAKGEDIDAFADPIARACKEIGVGTKSVTIKFAGFLTQETARGPELGMVFACSTDEEPKKGVWYPVDRLPDNIIPHHPPIIAIAVKAFQR